MSPEAKTQVAHLATYITDDGAIASYCGVTRDDVAFVRRNVVKAVPRRFLADRHERYAPGKESSGLQQVVNDRADARDGSERLRDRMEQAFTMAARKWGVDYLDARTLLMNAVSL